MLKNAAEALNQPLMLNTLCLAYIDPGTGSLIVQILLATVVGAVAFFRKALLCLIGRGDGKAKQGSLSDTDRR